MANSVDLLGQSISRFWETSIPEDISYQLVCGTAMKKDNKNKKIVRGGKGEINVSVDDIDDKADILFASVETLIQGKNYDKIASWLKNAQENGKIFLIYDEVHHIGAEKTGVFLNKLFGVSDGKTVLTNFGFIGLTATVYRYDSPIKSFNKWFKNGYMDGAFHTDNTAYGKVSDSYINNRIAVVSIKELMKITKPKRILMKPQIIRVDDFENGTPKSDEEAMSYLATKISQNYEEKTVWRSDNICRS